MTQGKDRDRAPSPGPRQANRPARINPREHPEEPDLMKLARRAIARHGRPRYLAHYGQATRHRLRITRSTPAHVRDFFGESVFGTT